MNERIIEASAAKLLLRTWPCLSRPRACICLVHGLGEHSGRYRHVVEFFQRAGFSVGAFDLRGHGRSSGKRGDCTHYPILLDDIQQVLENVGKEFQNQTRILYGHSFGGNLVLNYALRREPHADLLIATGPMLRTAQPPPAWKVFVGQVLKYAAPGFRLRNGIDADQLSSDPEIGKAYLTDKLNHPFVSVRLALAMIESGQWALEHAASLSRPLLLMHGADDRITSPQASAEFAERVGKLCQFKTWPSMRHELHNEFQHDAVLSHIAEWVDQQLSIGAVAPSKTFGDTTENGTSSR